MKSSAVITLLTLMASFPALAGFEEGSAAFDRGDYAKAMREWRPLAENGHALAQRNVALMYRQGYGVSRDFREAIRWYKMAAEQSCRLFSCGTVQRSRDQQQADHRTKAN